MDVQQHCAGTTAPTRCRLWCLVALMVAASTASCGGGSDPEPDAGPAAAETASDVGVGDVADAASDVATAGDAAGAVDAADVIEDPAGFAEAQAAALEEQQARQGGGAARLVVGDQEWTFDSVLCAFGENETGQPGAEFVLSSIQDGTQMYASIDSYGDSISLNDVQDFENPSVALSSVGDEFIDLDGKTVTATADFVDGTGDGFTPISGAFEATCP